MKEELTPEGAAAKAALGMATPALAIKEWNTIAVAVTLALGRKFGRAIRGYTITDAEAIAAGAEPEPPMKFCAHGVAETIRCSQCADRRDQRFIEPLSLEAFFERGRRAQEAVNASITAAAAARNATYELANQGPRETSVITYLTIHEAEALAQFIKRVGWDEISANAQDRCEAELMRDAIERLRRGLQESGFNPR